MDLIDALVVTALGMTVVFSGLILTSLLILSFGAVTALRMRARTASPAVGEAATSPTVSPTPEDDRILAVIATVLEVERRLHRAEPGGRLTIERSR